MEDPKLEVSNDKGATYQAALSTSDNKRLELSYRITTNGNNKLRLVLPINSNIEGDTKNSLLANKALMNKTDWDSVGLSVTSPQQGCSVSRSKKYYGVYDLTITNPATADFIILELNISEGENLSPIKFQNDTNPVATCALEVADSSLGYLRWLQKSSVEITIADDTIPAIKKFTSDRSFISLNGTVNLSWSVLNATSLSIVRDDEKVIESGITTMEGGFQVRQITRNTDFKLNAYKQDKVASFVTISIIFKQGGVVEKIDDLFDLQKIMGLYTYQNKLFALILEEEDKSQNVVLWETFDGLKWNRTSVYNSVQTFIDEKNSVNVPLDFSGSPGIILNNKLYLIGGSRYDANFKSNQVYYYDFADHNAGWKQDKDAAFTPRMGHSCVLYNNNSEIWVMGGLTDEGSTDEVYTFDGETWTLQSSRLLNPICMASAIAFNDINNADQIQVFGGFTDMPGNADTGLTDSLFYDKATKIWNKIRFNSTFANKFYNCTAVVWKDPNGKLDQRLLFIHYKDDVDTDKNEIYKIVSGLTNNFKLISQAGYGLDDLWYNIQAVTFKEVIWLCALQSMPVISENERLHYFGYSV
ncbi:MAG: Kelch repeat-containing protein [Sphingobacteriaceae bacterium]